MRSLKDYLIIFTKGLAMGAADVVPGVSGGTIAFISGIYEELLDSISAIKPSLIGVLKREGIPGVWRKVNANFLLALLLGVAVSIVSFAKLITWALQFYPIQIWSFFFGLILASIWYVGKQIKVWNIQVIMGVILGTLSIYYLTTLPPLGANTSYLFLFFAGAIASMAMILPGISGSFILLLLGAYTSVISAIGNQDIPIIAVVGLGAATGLIVFSSLLKYLLKLYHNTVMGILTGFLIGSLAKIWPWKRDQEVYLKEAGEAALNPPALGEYGSLSAYMQNASAEEYELISSYREENILPNTYELINPSASAEIFPAIIALIVGFSIIFILEFIAKRKANV